ncbi:MAG: hypothetical protein K2G19_00895, partial [Lachnospiraceae bacterium]|nr:hypothetical protein [Lachnospiraceae bacterium]
IMSEAYEKLDEFLSMFRQAAQPRSLKEDENSAAMVVYQASMMGTLKQILDMMKGDAAEQTAGVERIVDKFTSQMQEALGADFKELGEALRETGNIQSVNAANTSEMIEAVTALVEVNRNVQSALAKVMDRQEKFANELREQKEKLADTCNEMSDEITSQLYAFGHMRNMYEE